jgi:Poly(R)-hydroxyalkanoic acid synthase subunit (PHA_synth_III_E)
MQNPFAGAGSGPEAAVAAAAERFFELLKTFGMPAAGQVPDWASLATPLAGQFEQWLRMSQSAGPWFAPGASLWPGMPGAPGAAASAFGPLPLGPAAVQGAEAQRVWELLTRLTQLQTQLAAHWSEIASTAARRFVARMGAAVSTPPTLEHAMKLYELWVSCAEEAYAATVHREDFGRLQAELANTSAALLVEQRRHAEALVRAFGLPTRNEVDALYAQLKELRGQLGERVGTGEPPRKRSRKRAGPGGKRARARKPRA